MEHLSLEHPEGRKHKDKSDAGRSNYNERFLMDLLRSIPAILVMRRVPTLYSNETIKINCSSYNIRPNFWKYLVVLSSCFQQIFLVVLGFFFFVRYTHTHTLKINKIICKIIKWDFFDWNCFNQIKTLI